MRKITLILYALLCSFMGFSQVAEDFEGGMPATWTGYQTEADDPGFLITTTQEYSGSQSVYHNDDNLAAASTSWLVTDGYTITAGVNDLLEFWYRQNWTASYYNYSGIYISTGSSDPIANPGDFVELQEFNSSYGYSEDAWSQFSTDLTPYVGQTVYFALKYTGDLSHEFWVDDFTLTTPPSCPEPSDILVTNITATTADIEWTAGGAETEWEVVVQDADTGEPTANGVYTTDNPYTATNLLASNNYEVYVRAFCASDDLSEWVGPIAFDTECGVYTAPYTQDFENAGSLPLCWNQGAGNSEDWKFANSNGSNHIGNAGDFYGTVTPSGGYFAWVDDSSPHNTNIALETPMVDVSGLTDPSLNFWMVSDNEGYTNVSFSVDFYDGATWHTDVYTSNTNTGGWTQVIIDLSTYTITGPVQARFVVDENNGTDYYDDVAIDDVSFDEMPSCFPPENLVVSAVTSDSMTLSWDSFAGADTYEYIVMFQGLDPDTATPIVAGTTSDLTVDITGLSPITDYSVCIRSTCGGDDSIWSCTTFTTECAVFDAPFSENFADSSTPNCWTNSGDAAWEFSTGAGYAASDVEDHTPGGGTNYAWMDGTDNGDGEITSLTTPLIDVSTLTNPALIFYAFSDNTSDSAINILDVELYDGSTWNTVTTINTLLGSSWQELVFDLSSYTITGPVQVRFTVTGNDNGGSAFYNDILIDDVMIDEMPTCLTPSGLVVNTVSENSADLAWTAGGDETEWEIIYGPSGFDPTTAGTTVSDNDGTLGETLTGLTADTDYDFYVVAVCGAEQSFLAGPQSFYTGYCVSVPSSNDGGGISNLHIAGTDFASGGDITYEDFTGAPVDLPQGIMTNMEVDFDHTYQHDTHVWIDFNDNMVFESSELVFSGESGGTAPNVLDTSFLMPGDAPLGEHRMRIGTAYSGQSTPNPCYNGSWGVTIDVTINITPAPPCIAPLNVTATSVLADEATFDWDDFANAAGYDYIVVFQGVDPEGATPIAGGTVTDSEVTVTGLSPSTEYDFYVLSSCGADGDSAYSQAVSFTTPCVVFDAPYVEDFENGGTIPDCWNQGDANAEDWKFSNTPGSNHIGDSGDFFGTTTASGGYFAWVDDSTPDNLGTTLESPLVDISGLTDPALSFYIVSDNEGHTNVSFSVDFYDGSTWHSDVYTSNTNTGGWTQIFIDLSTYTVSGPVQARFIVDEDNASGDFYDDVAIDDVAFDEMPACLPPMNISVTNVTADDATVSWDAAIGATEYQYIVIYGGLDPETATPLISGTTTSTTVDISPLEAVTEYSVYIVTDCGVNGESSYSSAGNFTTPCATYVPSFYEEFDTFVPECWEEAAEGTPSEGPSALGGGLWSHDNFLNDSPQQDAARINLYGTGREEWLISPVIDLSGGDFKAVYEVGLTDFLYSDPPEYNGMGSDDEVLLLISEDGGTTWTTLVTYNQSNYPSHTGQNEVVDLSAYTGTVTFAFWATDGTVNDLEDYDFFLNFFWVIPLSEQLCFEPENVIVDNITADSADVSWDVNADAVSYEYVVVLEGQDPDTVTAVASGTTTNTTVNIPGLSDATTYDVYVAADCGGTDNGPWSTVQTFTTHCLPMTEFNENFDSVSTPDLPICWSSVIDNGASSFATVSTNSFNGYSAPNAVSMYNSSSSATSNMILVSPMLSNLDAGTHWFRFFARNSNDTQDVEVGTMSDPTDGSTFTVFEVVDIDGDYDEYAVDFSTYTGTDEFIAIRRISTSTYTYVYIDNAVWEERPSCIYPDDVEVLEAYADGADLIWDGPDNATGYEWVVVEAGGDPEDDSQIVASGTSDTNSALVEGLLSNTDYDFYVLADCGDVDGLSSYSQAASFTTLCALPTGLQVDEVGYEEVEFSWDDAPNSYGYEFLIVETGMAPIEENYVAVGTIAPGQMSIVVEYLEEGTEYDLYLRIVCDTGFYGQWGLVTFTTLDSTSSVGENTIEGFSFYPNPVKDVLQLEATQSIGVVTVYNMLGQEVKTMTPESLSAEIDMSNLQAGAYILKVTVGTTTGTYRVLKD